MRPSDGYLKALMSVVKLALGGTDLSYDEWASEAIKRGFTSFAIVAWIENVKMAIEDATGRTFPEPTGFGMVNTDRPVKGIECWWATPHGHFSIQSDEHCRLLFYARASGETGCRMIRRDDWFPDEKNDFRFPTPDDEVIRAFLAAFGS